VALLDAATPEGSFLVLARADSTRLGDRRLHVIGGRTVGREFLRRLAREGDLLVTLRLPDGETLTSDVRPDKGEWAVADQVRIPFVAQPDTGAPRLTQAALVVSYSLSPLVQLRQSAERWSVAAGLLAVLLAIVLGGWVAGRVSRPLTDLARKTAALDLTRLDVDFASERGDEVGTLAGVLAALGARLRKDAQRLRLAERRAAVGEFARQVNHDVKNGLVPIRNALRHLTETADQRPEELRRVFHERKATLDSGVRYLEKLAVNYARLSSRDAEGSADVRAVVDDVLGGAETGTVAVRSHIPASLPLVRGDPVVLRRILENLLTNAVDACLVNGGGRAGQVVVSAEWVRNEDAVRLAVKDTGVGMSVAQLERAFEDFYTTKPGGTGLGLTIVRRLVTDLDGSLKVTTVPGWGTTVEVKLPRAPAFRARPVGRT
jgi:signal transduction histidine kinase